MELAGPITRIGCRYAAGLCLAHGLAQHASLLTDPDFVQVLSYAASAVCAGISEGGYYLARKHGWHR